MLPKLTLFSSLFGRSQNEKLVHLLQLLSQTAVECAAYFRKTKGQDVHGIIEIEHRADAIVDEIHELLDNSYIMRFDIPDSMRLADDLDDVVDGMRKVVLHLQSYSPFISELSEDALEIFSLGEEMLQNINVLINMLAKPRLSLPNVRDVTNVIDAAEAKADKLVSENERRLVSEHSHPQANVLSFIAKHQLFHLLEQMTDDANHCAKMVLSLARKEA